MLSPESVRLKRKMCVASSGVLDICSFNISNSYMDAEVHIQMPDCASFSMDTIGYGDLKITVLAGDFEGLNADWREFTLNGEFQQRA